LPSGKSYRWEFEKRGQEMTVDGPGALTLDHIGLMVEAAVDRLGIAYVPERAAKPHLDAARLVVVLENWCPSIPGLFLYYPGRRHVPPPLKAFIEVIREVLP
jgi:DNA-binding transcriptional LysR family regulator